LKTETCSAPASLDTTFGNAGIASAHFSGFASTGAVAAVVQPDGKIVVAGTATDARPIVFNTSFALARFNANGSLDATFGSGGEVTTQLGPAGNVAVAIVLQPDGKIIVGGNYYTGIGYARYNTDGSLDSSFGSGGTVTYVRPGSWNDSPDVLTSLLLRPDGNIVTVTSFTGSFLAHHASVFGVGLFATLPGDGGGAALQPDGKILVANPKDSIWFLDRLNQDGSVDISPSVDFGTGLNSNGTVALQADGKIVTTGWTGNWLVYQNPDNSYGYALDEQPALARLNPDGTLDTSFGISGKLLTPLSGNPALQGGSTSGNLAIQSDGRILITSTLITHDPTEVSRLMRYLPDGSVDTGFGIDGSASPFPAGFGPGMALQADGSILVMGSVPAASGTGTDLAVARYLGGPSAALTGTANQRFVQQLYLDLLGRGAESGGLAFWSGLLDSGQATRIQVVQGIQQGAEYRSLVVASLYNLYLNRPVDALGEATWTSFLASGGTTDQLRAQILGSDEYASLHSAPGYPSFLEGLYRDVLYRTMDPVGETAWTHAAVALAIIQSQEGASDEVQSLYHRRMALSSR
jgi:uncharacterized delta-60 repeat protein